MPARKKRNALTLGDVAAKVSQIQFNNVVYVALLISVFISGYLYSQVQTLKKSVTLGSNAQAIQVAHDALTKIAQDGGSVKPVQVAQDALKQLDSAPSVAGVQTTPSAQAAQPKISLSKVKDDFSKSIIKFGDTNGKLTVIEVADPSCPYCHIAGGKDPELNKQVGTQFTMTQDGGTYDPPVTEFKKLLDAGKISFAYIYYPGHGNGEMGMKALYCANEQGKFWDVNDLLMSNAGYNLMNNDVKNDTSKSQTVADFLASAIDPSFMKSCIDSGKYDAQLKTDSATATDLQIQGTPGFYLNDTVYPGAYSYTDMQATVKSAGI